MSASSSRASRVASSSFQAYVNEDELVYSDSDSEDEFDESEWQSMIVDVDAAETKAWKKIAMKIMKSYTESTDGSWIEDKEYCLVWHYEACDPEFGSMQVNAQHRGRVRVCVYMCV